MNLLSVSPIVVAAVLGLSGSLAAQTPEATQIPPFPEATQSPPIPMRPPGAWKNAPSDEDLQELGTFLNLGQGTMAKAAESLRDQYFEKFAKTGLVDNQMPKLIYGPGAKEAKIEGELKLSLYNLRAVDAVALIAAAAGCRLEPIPAPPDSPEDNKNPKRVVGYHVTVATRPVATQTVDIAPVVRSLPSGVAVPTPRPLPPPPPALKVVEPVVDHFIFTNTSVMPTPAVPGVPSTSPSPVPAGPIVRIYPMGFFLKGNENDEEYAKKHLSLEQLVRNALEQAKLDDKEEPVLSLHAATKVLIVRASAAQHELIQQIVTSLKENAQTGSQETTTVPR